MKASRTGWHLRIDQRLVAVDHSPPLIENFTRKLDCPYSATETGGLEVEDDQRWLAAICSVRMWLHADSDAGHFARFDFVVTPPYGRGVAATAEATGKAAQPSVRSRPANTTAGGRCRGQRLAFAELRLSPRGRAFSAALCRGERLGLRWSGRRRVKPARRRADRHSGCHTGPPMAPGPNLLEELRRRRHQGDPRFTEEDKAILRRITTGDLADEFADSLAAMSDEEFLPGRQGPPT